MCRLLARWISSTTPVVLLLFGVSAAMAQSQATVDGRVIEREGGAAVAGATIELTGRAPVLTDPDGRFRFERLNTGRYSLTASGIGYATDERTLIVRGDTTLVIELDRRPVPLDTLAVEGYQITLRGEVRDRATDTGLIDVDVMVAPDLQTMTDPLGRFKLSKVPANTPVVLRVREFGYLPVTTTLTASRDTTLRFDLEPDPVTAAMIAEQKRRISVRAADQRYGFDDVIDRPLLLRNLSGSPWDLINRILGARARKVQCIIIDERRTLGAGSSMAPIQIGRRGRVVAAEGVAVLSNVLPDRLEYMDILKFGRENETLMIRAYTREFIQRMTGGAEELVPLSRIIEAAHLGVCR